MDKDLYLHLEERICRRDPYFLQKPSICGQTSKSTRQKLLSCFRILSLGLPVQAVDEFFGLSEATARKSLRHFLNAVIAEFGEEFLREPNQDEVDALLARNAARGFPGSFFSVIFGFHREKKRQTNNQIFSIVFFSLFFWSWGTVGDKYLPPSPIKNGTGMLGSLDCMHVELFRLKKQLHGQFKNGRNKHPTRILEAVADENLRSSSQFLNVNLFFRRGPGGRGNKPLQTKNKIFAFFQKSKKVSFIDKKKQILARVFWDAWIGE